MRKPTRIASAFIILYSAFVLVGCSSPGGQVTFDGANGPTVQRFSEAYIAQTRSSEAEIVLIDDAADQQYKPSPKDQALQPVALPPLRQIMRIHLYWRPLALTTKNPAAINASLTWYVLGPDGSSDVMTYEGAAFVVLEGGGTSCDVRIKDGQIAPKSNNSEGRLRDPIGPARISGKVLAVVNKARVDETLKEMGIDPDADSAAERLK